MRKLTILLFIACAVSVARGAEYTIPSSRTPASGTWQSAGVPGGIPTRSTIYTTITSTGDSTDRSSTINTALTDCPADQVVLLGPGNFVCNSTILLTLSSGVSNVTLRGSLNPDGSPASTIDTRTSVGISLGNNYEYNWPSGGAVATVASLTKGATTITVADSSPFSSGQLIRIALANDGTVPIFGTYSNQWLRAQVAKIADSGGVPNSTTLVLDSPGLHGDYTGASSVRISTSQFKTPGNGVENLIVTGANSGAVTSFGIQIDTAYGCWVYNCKSMGASSYPVIVQNSFRCEVRQTWCDFTDGSSSSVGMLVSQSASILGINNVIYDSAFGFYQQQLCSGNVFAYNVIIKPGGNATTNSNHGPWSQFTLFEGNIGGAYQNDGYFGGTGYDTIFRNWWMGTPIGTGTPGFTAAANRLSYYENFVGNVLGKTGIGGGSYTFGNPNIGNSGFTGTSSFKAALSELTTRTSATVGTITAPSGHGISTSDVIDVFWMEDFGSYGTAKIRRGVTVGTVSGTSIPISGGLGDDLPVLNADIYVPTSNTAIIDYPIDWDSTAQAPKSWPGTLTTRTSDTAGVITLDGGEVADFTAAFAETSNSFRGISWGADQRTVSVVVTDITGDAVTFNTASSTLPSASTAMTFNPSFAGYQGFDVDVLYTSLLKGNYLGLSSGSGIPAVESLGGDTLPDSLFLSGTPDFFTTAGLSFPPINANSPVENTYELIPAGIAMNDGWWPTGSGGGTQATVTGTATVSGTLTLP